MVVIEGVVQHGRRLGRQLGFPTANLPVTEAVTVENGVYESRAVVDGTTYRAMSNLGRNPSVGEVERRLETHIFDFEGSLYGRKICVELVRKIRDELKFDSLEALREQIQKDKEEILKTK